MQFDHRCIGILIVLLAIAITDASVVPRRAVLGFSSNVQRKRSSSSSTTPTSGSNSSRFTAPSSPSSSSAVSAATINARELFDGTFYSSDSVVDEDENIIDDNHEEKDGHVLDHNGAQEHHTSRGSNTLWGMINDGRPNSSSATSKSNNNNSIPSVASRIIDQFSNNTSNHPAILLSAIIAALITSRRGLWLRSFKSTLRLLSSLSSWYLSRLEISPLLTKCITGGIIAWIGDYGAQLFEYKLLMKKLEQRLESSSSMFTSVGGGEGGGALKASSSDSLFLRAGASDNAYQHYHQHHPQHHHQQQHTSATTAVATPLSIHNKKTKNIYDYRRGLARFLECLLVSSPLMHYGYELFEYVLPVVAGDGLYRSLAALSHVVADSVFLDGIFVCTGIIATGLLEGHSLRRHVLPNLRNVYLPTMKASVCTSSALIPLQFLSFRFLPVQLRVLSVNAVDLIWTGVVSFVSHSGGGVGEMEA